MKQQAGFIRRAVRDYGAPWIVRRGWYELQLRSGWHRLRFRQRPWREDELGCWLEPAAAQDPLAWARDWARNRPRHFVDAAMAAPDRAARLRALFGPGGAAALREEAEATLRGELRYFSDRLCAPQAAIDWHRNPFTGQASAAGAHWSRLPMFSPRSGDLKFIWEPGRFASAYLLARAWVAFGDERYAEGFWDLVAQWGDANPPHHGAHWKCGQETSLRLMAWGFALHTLAGARATTPERVARIAGMMAAQAGRVAADRVYAHLQTNNHSISEGVGLWTVGLLFPALREAAHWRELGREMLEHDAVRLIAVDGSFIQKSMNYHRLMLHDYLYAIRLGEVNGESFSPRLRERVGRAAGWLEQLVDASGCGPNLGANDGALILPLNTCDYDDLRPVSDAARFAFQRSRRFASGPWHEDLFWLFGPEALGAASTMTLDATQALSAPQGGYYVLRGATTWALVRCPDFHDRPGHADALHLDLWRAGQNVAIDAGTFLYYADAPWANGLATSLVHNTVTIDGLDQMERGPRFMWMEWLRAKVLRCERDLAGRIDYFEGEHDGYRRLPQPVMHRRGVLRLGEDVWCVVDDVFGVGTHEARLHWLLADVPFAVLPHAQGVRLELRNGPYDVRVMRPVGQGGAVGPLIQRADERSPLGGWQSRRYGRREPAISTAWTVGGLLPVRFVTLFCPPDMTGEFTGGGAGLVCQRGAWRAELGLGACGAERIVREVRIEPEAGDVHRFSFLS